jgi:hypothetical protein
MGTARSSGRAAAARLLRREAFAQHHYVVRATPIISEPGHVAGRSGPEPAHLATCRSAGTKLPARRHGAACGPIEDRPL